MQVKPAHRTPWLAAASLIVVFMLDSITPEAYIIDILYLCSILLVFREKTSTIVVFAGAACLLIVFDALVEQQLELNHTVWINRGISIVAILITSYIAWHYRQVYKRAQLRQQQQLKSLGGMLYLLSHKVRAPLASILGITEVIKEDGPEISIAELKTRCEYLFSSANDLDAFVKELNAFMDKAEKESRE
jgi:signal transduction histidine kinase